MRLDGFKFPSGTINTMKGEHFYIGIFYIEIYYNNKDLNTTKSMLKYHSC